MKKVLFVVYYYPPAGGPGVQRVLKHIKYLREFGYQPVILTVENGEFPARDESLLDEAPKDVEVYRTRILEPYDLYRKLLGKKKSVPIDVNNIKRENEKLSFKERFAEFVRSTFFIPDGRMFWRFTAVKKGVELVKELGIDAIYSSSPPFSCSVIARQIALQTKKPWVAGFRDPWTNFIISPKRWFLPAAIDKMMERNCFETADAVECAWEGIIKDAMGKYPLLNRNKFYHVPNGFDSSDFPKIDYRPNDKFTLVYTGSMYGRRNPAALFEALENLIKAKKVDPKDFNLVFVGRFGGEVQEMFDNASFKDSIEVVAYLPHEQSIEKLLLSDAILLIVDESKESEEIVPGKVYEYIGARKPILSIAPRNSAIARLIAETKCGSTAHQSELEAIGDIFMSYFNAWKDGRAIIQPNDDEINKYERRNSAKLLSEIMDSLIKK